MSCRGCPANRDSGNNDDWLEPKKRPIMILDELPNEKSVASEAISWEDTKKPA